MNGSSIFNTHLAHAHYLGLVSDILALDLGCREYSPHHPPPEKSSKPLYTCAIGRISPHWKNIQVLGRSPVARFGHQAMLVGHNSKQRKGYQISVFGGYGSGIEFEQWRRRINLQGLRSDVCGFGLFMLGSVILKSHYKTLCTRRLRLLLFHPI